MFFNEDHNNHEILILYGSQTGTARFASEEFQRELFKFNFYTKICAMDSYNYIDLPEENYIIFIISTTGYGEFPSNSKNFWNFIMRKDLPEDSLENINYTLFGLGDSSYEKFNVCGKLLNSRLTKLSANLFHKVALGDDQHDFGYEAEFDPWMNSVIEELFCYFPQKIPYRDKPNNIFNIFKQNINFEVDVISNDFNQIQLRNIFENENKNDDHINMLNNSINIINNVTTVPTDKLSEVLNKYYLEKLNSYGLKKDILKQKIGFITRNEIITSEDSIKKVFNVEIRIEHTNCNFENVLFVTKNSTNVSNIINNKLIELVNNNLFYKFIDPDIINFTENLTVDSKDVKVSKTIIPGDLLLLFPENDEETVNQFLKLINLKENDYITE